MSASRGLGRVVAALFALALVVVLGLTVWPTPYRWASLRGAPVRVHRVTGVAEMLTDSGWTALRPDTNPFRPIADELKRAEGRH